MPRLPGYQVHRDISAGDEVQTCLWVGGKSPPHGARGVSRGRPVGQSKRKEKNSKKRKREEGEGGPAKRAKGRERKENRPRRGGDRRKTGAPATPPHLSHHRKGGQPRRDRRRHHRRHQRLAEQVKGHRYGGGHGQRHAPAESNVLQHCEGTKRGGGQCKAAAEVVGVDRMTRTPRGKLEQQRRATIDTQSGSSATEEPKRCTE